MSESLTQTYEPHPALRAMYQYLFDRIQVDKTWVSAVRDAAARGAVVYVLRNLNFIDFFALDHLTKRYGLPQVRFVNDMGLGILAPMGKGWLKAIWPTPGVTQADELRDALAHGGSAALFLKRPPTVRDVATGASGRRGLSEGNELVDALIALQRETDRHILLMPQVFVWTKRPDTAARGPLDAIFGTREWPSPLRTAGEFLTNSKHVVLRAGEPLSLRDFLATQAAGSDQILISRLTYAMLARLERERRAVTGPAGKPPDRVRHEILRSPRFRGELSKVTKRTGMSEAEALKRAESMLESMQANPAGATISALDFSLDKVFHRIYAGIDTDPEGLARLRAAAKDGPLILLPSHKSHADYLILSFVFFHENMPLPMIAAGDNLAFFPLGPLLRRAGAFFIRRSFQGDSLYPIVVDAYVRRLIREGFPMELFLEGGRSRNGKLLPPKFGLLRMIVGAALATPEQKVHFVPISIGYERIVETGAFERELSGGEKAKEDAAGLLSATEVLRYRYGRINLQFGQILTLNDIRRELNIPADRGPSPKDVRNMVTRLGNRVMDEINRVTAVTPGSLAALALLADNRRGIPHERLVRHCRRLLCTLQALGARCAPALVTSSGALRPESIREAAQMFLDAELLEAFEPAAVGGSRPQQVQASPAAIYSIPETKRLGLDTIKNINIHFFVERALVATAMLAPGEHEVPRTMLRDRVRELSRLFKHEFRFRADAPFKSIFDQTLEQMQSQAELEITEHGVKSGNGREGWTGQRWLVLYSGMLRNFLEGYRIAARSLEALLSEPLTEKDLVKKALATGNVMYLAGEVDRRESISKPLISNALSAFVDQGVLTTRDKRLELKDRYLERARLAELEHQIAYYLEREAHS